MQKQGLYLPEFERDNCGAGFICNLHGKKSNKIIHDALEILVKLEHRGAVSFEAIRPFPCCHNSWWRVDLASIAAPQCGCEIGRAGCCSWRSRSTGPDRY